MTKSRTISVILNAAVFIITFFATFCMIAGIQLMNKSEEIQAFTSSNLAALKYFTVDSNVLAGLVALAFVIVQLMIAKGRLTTIPKFFYALKLAGTAGVTLTMMVTICFLIPQFGKDWLVLFMNNNLFFHLIVPLICIIDFIFFVPVPENKPVPLKYSFAGTVPMALYAVFYTTNIITHLGNGLPIKTYDWYNFLGGKLSNAFIAVPAMIIVTWLLSLALWAANNRLHRQ